MMEPDVEFEIMFVQYTTDDVHHAGKCKVLLGQLDTWRLSSLRSHYIVISQGFVMVITMDLLHSTT